MSLYNEILVGRYARGLQKTFGIKGTPPSKQLGGDIVPTFPIRPGTDYDYLNSVNRYGGAATGGAVAGQVSFMQLRNPAGSGVVAEILKITVAMGVAGVLEIAFGVGVAQGASTIAPGRLDGRLGNNAFPSSLVLTVGSAVSPAGGLPVIWQFRRSTIDALDVILTEQHQLPLLPGDVAILFCNQVNTALDGTIWWRERVLEDSERSLSPAGG